MKNNKSIFSILLIPFLAISLMVISCGDDDDDDDVTIPTKSSGTCSVTNVPAAYCEGFTNFVCPSPGVIVTDCTSGAVGYCDIQMSHTSMHMQKIIYYYEATDTLAALCEAEITAAAANVTTCDGTFSTTEPILWDMVEVQVINHVDQDTTVAVGSIVCEQ